ncbi:MAG: phosphatidylglycerophosphatase A [Candidatus Omnitrophica bacterium]|nr:phosphatidylglycerophosphatase A [Candidatus Omnitrophota bacterium]
MKNLIKLIASFFYLGYAPVIPGTVASLAGLGLYFLFKDNIYSYTILLILLSALGFLVAGSAEKIFQEKDSRKIVIDEVAGLLLAFWGLRLEPVLLITGFFIFRALDAIKVYPANRLEKIDGSCGIMGDDLIAGLYTNIVLRIVTAIIAF